MRRNTMTGGAAVLLAAVGLGVAGLPVAAQGPGGGPGTGMGMGPGGGPCPMMLEWFDDNDDGRITLQEFRAGHDERFVEIDVNGDGKVTLEEFQAAPKPGRQVRAQRMFRRLDTNADATLSREELAARAEWRFQRMDADGNQEITTEELQQAMPGGRGPGGGPDGGPGATPR